MTDITTREAFADTLKDHNDQRQWYSRRASDLKVRAQRIDIAIIVGGALVAALAAFTCRAPILVWIVAGVGAGIAILQGAQRIYRYGEIWPEYRRASERMKRERRLFVQGAGHYRPLADADAQAVYVENLEAIIADEQKIFFDGAETRGNGPS